MERQKIGGTLLIGLMRLSIHLFMYLFSAATLYMAGSIWCCHHQTETKTNPPIVCYFPEHLLGSLQKKSILLFVRNASFFEVVKKRLAWT